MATKLFSLFSRAQTSPSDCVVFYPGHVLGEEVVLPLQRYSPSRLRQTFGFSQQVLAFNYHQEKKLQKILIVFKKFLMTKGKIRVSIL